jgi:hypothetical protein
MDTWMTSLMSAAPKTFVNGTHAQADVVAAKPATAFDFCYLTTDTTFSTKITDFSVCDGDPHLKANSSPRQVAGGPLAENIMKCQLKAINPADYPGIMFSAGQMSRLNAVFPNGVCDWTKAGVSQQSPTSPMTFAAGPGGTPLPAAPSSTAL